MSLVSSELMQFSISSLPLLKENYPEVFDSLFIQSLQRYKKIMAIKVEAEAETTKRRFGTTFRTTTGLPMNLSDYDKTMSKYNKVSRVHKLQEIDEEDSFESSMFEESSNPSSVSEKHESSLEE